MQWCSDIEEEKIMAKSKAKADVARLSDASQAAKRPDETMKQYLERTAKLPGIRVIQSKNSVIIVGGVRHS
jgi:hypothetical protein